MRAELDPSGRITGNEPFFIPPEPVEASPTRDTTYLMEGGPTIEAELGMQLYEDRYINQVFGPGAGPGQGNYSGKAWRDWQISREFQLMTGQRFLFGIDKMNANVPGSYEWVEQWEQWNDDLPPVRNPDGSYTVTARVINRGHYRLVPGTSGDQSPQRPNIRDVTPVLEKIRYLGDNINEPELKSHLQSRLSLLFTAGCAEAFRRAGLPTPEEIISKGLTIASRPLLDRPANNATFGITEPTRQAFAKSKAPALTIRSQYTSKGPIIFFRAEAFLDLAYLDESVPHEFIHAAGVGQFPHRFYSVGIGHDLSNYKFYGDIMSHCSFK